MSTGEGNGSLTWHPVLMTDPVSSFRRAADVVAAAAPSTEGVLRALSDVQAVRVDLDRIERELIGTAREQSIGWPEIAGALGLGSRQAAEQRWLRLRGAETRDPIRVRRSQREQRIVDNCAGPELAELRRAAIQACRHIEADHEWDHRHRRAGLVRISLAAAVTAAPSALYALCDHASSDLDAMRAVRLPSALAAATRRLIEATGAARAMPGVRSTSLTRDRTPTQD